MRIRSNRGTRINLMRRFFVNMTSAESWRNAFPKRDAPLAAHLDREFVRDGSGAVCVGYDGRLSSPEMEQAVVDGLIDCGLEVVRVGLGPTPMLYFAVNVLSAAWHYDFRLA